MFKKPRNKNLKSRRVPRANAEESVQDQGQGHIHVHVHIQGQGQQQGQGFEGGVLLTGKCDNMIADLGDLPPFPICSSAQELSDEASEEPVVLHYAEAEILTKKEMLRAQKLARRERMLQHHLEKGWGSEAQVEGAVFIREPIKWGLLFILLMIPACLLWPTIMNFSGVEDLQAKQQRTEALLVAEEKLLEDSRRLTTSVHEAISAFITAESADERLRYSRHPQRVSPLMQEYYQREEMNRLPRGAEVKIRFMDEAPQVKNPQHKHYFLLVEVTSEDYKKKLLVEITESGRPLIDWEGFVYYRPMAWDDYMEKKPAEPMVFRSLVRANQYYLMPYEDEETYFALELRDTKSKRGGLAYIRRDHPKFDLLKEVVENARSKRPFPFILEIEMPQPAEGTRSIFVKDILSVGGVYMGPTIETRVAEAY